MTAPDENTVIIGAGPAGLAAGYELARKGVPAVILERSGRIGGLARTETYNGYHFDIGGHRFYTKIAAISQLWKEMLGDDFLKIPRLSRIFFQDQFYKYPLAFPEALLKLGVIEGFMVLFSYLHAQLRPSREEDNFEQWVTNRFGSRLYNKFFKAYTEKVWGIPCDRLRADWAAQRIKGLSLSTTLTNALFGTRGTRTLLDEFFYPKEGPGMMWRRLEEAFGSAGGRISLNSEVTGITCENDRVVSVKSISNEGPVEIPVRHVISSVPVNVLVTMLDPKAPPNVLEAAGRLRYRAFVLVGLIADGKDLFPDQWIYVHSPDVKVGRIQNFKNWSPAMVPDPDKTSVGMEYFCDEGDDLWTMSDDELISLASEELARLGLAGPSDVEDGLVIRQPNAYPIYESDYLESLGIIRSFLERFTNLQTIGRNGMHRYNNMDHSMHTGMLAAQNVLGESHNLWKANEEKVYVEQGVK